VPLPPGLISRRDNDQRHSLVGVILCQLAATNEGQLVAAALALQQELKAYGTDIHDLVEHLERGGGGNGLSDAAKERVRAELEQAYNDGYAEGVRAAESKQHGTGAFRNTDGSLEWTEVALFVQREKHRLPAKHHEFVDDMAGRTVYGREPTPRQHQYLHSLFYKLGGKIT
jgi:hypothetical protein